MIYVENEGVQNRLIIQSGSRQCQARHTVIRIDAARESRHGRDIDARAETKCQTCKKGHIKAQGGGTVCLCTAGSATYCIITLSQSRVYCRERRAVTVHAPLSVAAAAQECEACAAGLYSDNPAASTCDACRKTFYSVAGADKCSPCQALGCETTLHVLTTMAIMAWQGRAVVVILLHHDHMIIVLLAFELAV